MDHIYKKTGPYRECMSLAAGGSGQLSSHLKGVFLGLKLKT